MEAWKMTNKKKVRGWKRQVRKIEKWKQRVLNLDMEYIAQHQRDYAKLWIDPWYRLIRRNPPVWFRRLILQAMFEVYLNWYKQMKATGEAFYLTIWLYEPHFINSQIVVAYRDCLHLYDQTFDKAWYEKTFPFSKYTNAALCDLLHMFDWSLHVDANHYYESDVKDGIEQGWHSQNYAEKLKRKAYQTSTDNDDTIYVVRVGDVWVGQLKCDHAEFSCFIQS